MADTRIHGTTRRQVGKHFAEVERAALVPLPLAPFPSFHEAPPHRAPRRPRRGRAGLLRGAAGVPGAGGLGAVGRPPGADLQRADGADRRASPGRSRAASARHREFIAAEKISGVERGAAWLLGRVTTRLGPQSTAWAEAMIRGPRRRGRAGAPGSLEPCRPPSRPRRSSRPARSPPVTASYRLRTIRALIEAPGTEARIAAIRERASDDPTA